MTTPIPDDVRRAVEREIDRLEPDTLPSERRVARLITSCARGYPVDVLELRDPNDGLGRLDTQARHHYTRAGGRIWTRRLPPSPDLGMLVQSDPDRDEWSDDPHGSGWRPWTRAFHAPSVLQAFAGGLPLVPPPLMTVEHRDLHGDGGDEYPVYAMGPGSWSAITDVPCPVEGCDHTLVWYEAGYVPGYRVCMAPWPAVEGGYDMESLRHRFLSSGPADGCMYLVREHDRETSA